MFRILVRNALLIYAVTALTAGVGCKGKSKVGSSKKAPDDGLEERRVDFKDSKRVVYVRLPKNMKRARVKYGKGWSKVFQTEGWSESGKTGVHASINVIEGEDDDEEDDGTMKSGVAAHKHSLKKDKHKIEQDEKLTNGHLLVSRNKKGDLWVVVMRPIAKGKKGRIECSTTIRKASEKLLPLIIKSCKTMR